MCVLTFIEVGILLESKSELTMRKSREKKEPGTIKLEPINDDYFEKFRRRLWDRGVKVVAKATIINIILSEVQKLKLDEKIDIPRIAVTKTREQRLREFRGQVEDILQPLVGDKE